MEIGTENNREVLVNTGIHIPHFKVQMYTYKIERQICTDLIPFLRERLTFIN